MNELTLTLLYGVGVFSTLVFFLWRRNTISPVKKYNNILANLGLIVAILTPIIAYGGEEMLEGGSGFFAVTGGIIGIIAQMVILLIMCLVNIIDRSKKNIPGNKNIFVQALIANILLIIIIFAIYRYSTPPPIILIPVVQQ